MSQTIGHRVARLALVVTFLGAATVVNVNAQDVGYNAMPNVDFAKWPKVSEVAASIAFLASPQNAVTRGALVPAYGQS